MERAGDTPTTGAPPAEPPSPSPQAEPQAWERAVAGIRTYLARDFVYESWYPRIRDILANGRRAVVFALLPKTARGRAVAGRICGAVLSSHRVRAAKVIFSRASVACP